MQSLPSLPKFPNIQIVVAQLYCRYPDFVLTESGLQYKDLREGSGESAHNGAQVTIDWDGYTIGYYGRPFEARNKVSMLLYAV